MKDYSLQELAEALQSRVEGEAAAQALFRGISTDTRTIAPESVFIALSGERYNAHEFLEEAARAGAAAFVVSEPEAAKALPEEWKRPWIRVEDSTVALEQAAAWYREKISGQVIGITGSVGKTSTREMVIAALNHSLKVSGTRANLNNRIGLAGTILASDEHTGALVLEMGIDRPGDMRRLTNVARPDIAIITGIGVSHIAQFKTRQGILEAKLQIAEGLSPGGWLLLNGDNDLLSSYAHNLREQAGDRNEEPYQIAFVSAQAEPDDKLPGRLFFARNIRSDQTGLSYDCWERRPGQEAELWISGVRLASPGRHQIINSLFGLMTADLLGVRREAARDGLLEFVITGNRQRLMEARGITMINDSYNASPESMRAALELLQTLGGERRKVAVLGGMNELGDLEETLHFQLGLDTARAGVDMAWVCGPLAEHVRKGIHSLIPDCPVEIFPDRESLVPSLLGKLEDNDILLIKGSRSFEMEKVAEAVAKARFIEDQPERT